MSGVVQVSSVVLAAAAALAVINLAGMGWSIVAAERDHRETMRLNARIAEHEARMAETLRRAEEDAIRIRLTAENLKQVRGDR